jgi:hypothetical protein
MPRSWLSPSYETDVADKPSRENVSLLRCCDMMHIQPINSTCSSHLAWSPPNPQAPTIWRPSISAVWMILWSYANGALRTAIQSNLQLMYGRADGMSSSPQSIVVWAWKCIIKSNTHWFGKRERLFRCPRSAGKKSDAFLAQRTNSERQKVTQKWTSQWWLPSTRLIYSDGFEEPIYLCSFVVLIYVTCLSESSILKLFLLLSYISP